MSDLKTILFTAAVLTVAAVSARAEPKIVASIKPVHSLVAGIMRGVGAPALIVEGAGSPHDYALKPSQAGMLEKADLVFWVGRELETFLEKPIGTIAAGAVSVELIDAPGLRKLGLREDGAVEDHEHEDHEHEDHGHEDHGHKGCGHKGHESYGHERHGHEGYGHKGCEHEGHDPHGPDEEHTDGGDAHDEHAHDVIEPHIWLDPWNAKALVREIENALVKADPANAEAYAANANAVAARLDALTDEASAMLAPVRDKRFIVFHDAYRYFETRFGIAASGSVTVSPEIMPGADRLGEIRTKVKRLGATCVFAEPQFTPKLVSVVTEGTNAKSGVLDPLGATLEEGPDLYFSLIRNMAASIGECLSGTG